MVEIRSAAEGARAWAGERSRQVGQGMSATEAERERADRAGPTPGGLGADRRARAPGARARDLAGLIGSAGLLSPFLFL